MEIKPSGNITFLFTDIEGSTRLSQEFPQTLSAALEIHNKILYDSVESNNGFVFKDTGDGICAAFENAVDAVKAAVDAQINLANKKWTDAEIKVRMGIHSGVAEWNGKDYMGYITLARSARVMSSAYGEQILISDDTYMLISESNDLTQKPEGTGTEIKNLVSLCLDVDNTICFRDLGERRLKDVIKPIRLYQVNAPGLREDFPLLKTLDARPNNLPVQITSFIGREKELKHVKELLSQTHLLTLLGTGGAGKSRLSLQTGADLIDDFANGVWFVELAPVSEPKLLIQTVMSAIGILENPKESPEVSLTGYLKDKEILIILDNCEHLIEECAELVENLLLNCPKLKILATSREALKCSGELIYRIPSLSHPNPEAKETPEQLIQYESVRLFIERALTVNTKFRVNNENAPALAEICSRLDGIPLAIELAAARTKILTVEKIYQRLDDRFRLLTGGKRTALPRQQTLRALVDWSYDLLTEDEKILWSRLSVFRGGWTLEAAEDICSDELLDEYEVIELLQNLSEKSIIIFDNANERYRMLETIRQYGDEKLRNSEEYNILSKKHLKYFTNLAETADLKLQGPEIVKWLKVLDDEKGNLERGLSFSEETDDKEAEAGLAGALGDYWEIRGQFTEGISRFQKIYLNFPESMKPVYNKILFLIGKFEFRKGKFEKAKKFFDESHDHFVKLNDKSGIGSALNCLGRILKVKGEYDKAIDTFEESLLICRETGDKRGIAGSIKNMGIIYMEKGEYDKSADLHEESLSLSREVGDKRAIADTLNNLGVISFCKVEYDKASDLYEESLTIRRDIGEKRGIAGCLMNLGIIYLDKGEYDKAVDFYEKSMLIHREIGNKRGIASCLDNLGIIFQYKGEYDKAVDLSGKGLLIYSDIDDKRGIADSLNNMGTIFMDKGEYDKATDLYEESLSICRDVGDKRGTAGCLINLGIISKQKGEYDKAIDLSEESMSISRDIGDKRGIAIYLINLGDICMHKGEFDKAINFYEKSMSINFDIGDKREISDCLYKLGVIYMYKEEFEKATDLFEESLSISRDIGYKKGISVCLSDLGIVNSSVGKYDKAQKLYQESLSHYIDLGSKINIANNLLRLTELHLKTKSDISLSSLLGFIKHYSELMKIIFSESEQKMFDESFSKLKKDLGEAEFFKSFEEGKSMTLEEAVEIILNIKL